jgi:DNA polymerase III subunit epsilon
MIVAGYDIETTGLNEPEHRIIECHVGRWDHLTRHKISGQTWRIHPRRSIAAAAQAVHHISITDLEGCPVWDAVAGDVRSELANADILVGHNSDGFDLPFINRELERIKLPRIEKPSIDTMVEGRWATPTGAVPTLGALCWACDVPYDPKLAHAADYDVDRTIDCFFAALDWGWIKLEDVRRGSK